MVVDIAGLRITNRKVILPLLGCLRIEPLQALLNSFTVENVDSILMPNTRNNLRPKVLALPSGRPLIDDVSAFFVVPTSAKTLDVRPGPIFLRPQDQL